MPRVGRVFPTLRSIPAPDALAELVRRSYDLDVVDCVLIRSFVNEVYEIRTSDRRYVLKVYHHGGWSAEEIAWEAELVDHLIANGIQVARVLRQVEGDAVGSVDAPEGPRPFLLSEYVEGRKPQKPFDDALYHEYGRLVARLHEAGDGFRTERYRRPWLELTLDEPLERVLPSLADQPRIQRLVRDLGVAARRRLTQPTDNGLDWGIRHGDVTIDNIHRTDAGLVIHDFDLAHVGWRVADLIGCLSTPFADAFRTGYTEVRALCTADLAAMPWLTVVETIGNLAFHLTEKSAWRGTETLTEGWVDGCLDALRTAADQLL